jgi:hypothetical protein
MGHPRRGGIKLLDHGVERDIAVKGADILFRVVKNTARRLENAEGRGDGNGSVLRIDGRDLAVSRNHGIAVGDGDVFLGADAAA